VSIEVFRLWQLYGCLTCYIDVASIVLTAPTLSATVSMINMLVISSTDLWPIRNKLVLRRHRQGQWYAIF
jgi:hypothetical protein